MTIKKKRKPSPKKVHRVYCTYFDDGKFYIGYSCKPEKQFEKYFGSSSYVSNYEGEMRKEVVAEYDSKAHAKAVEHLLQWEHRLDERCINGMWNVRLRLSHLRTLQLPDWRPGCFSQHS
jgi:hypothetical protein